MKVFISWSGDRSRQVAEALKEWLPDVVQAMKPWMSAVDIEKGTRWSAEIAAQLDEADAGIICVTQDNVSSAWLNFEAGALSRFARDAYVCAYLLDLRPGALVTSPLGQFQLTVSERDDTLKLIRTLNGVLGPSALDGAQVERSFDRCWHELESRLDAVRSSGCDSPSQEPSRVETLLEEVLVTVRAISSTVNPGKAATGSLKAPRLDAHDEERDSGEPKASPVEDASVQAKAGLDEEDA